MDNKYLLEQFIEIMKAQEGNDETMPKLRSLFNMYVHSNEKLRIELMELKRQRDRLSGRV